MIAVVHARAPRPPAHRPAPAELGHRRRKPRRPATASHCAWCAAAIVCRATFRAAGCRGSAPTAACRAGAPPGRNAVPRRPPRNSEADAGPRRTIISEICIIQCQLPPASDGRKDGANQESKGVNHELSSSCPADRCCSRLHLPGLVCRGRAGPGASRLSQQAGHPDRAGRGRRPDRHGGAPDRGVDDQDLRPDRRGRECRRRRRHDRHGQGRSRRARRLHDRGLAHRPGHRPRPL